LQNAKLKSSSKLNSSSNEEDLLSQLLCRIGLTNVEADLLQLGLSSDGNRLQAARRQSMYSAQSGILLLSGSIFLPSDLALQILRNVSGDLRLLGSLPSVSRSWNHLARLADIGENSIWRCQASRLGISQQLDPCSWKSTVQQGGAFVRQILGAARAFLAPRTPHFCTISELPNSLHFRFSAPGAGPGAPVHASMWAVAQPFFRCPESGFGCPLSRAILRGFLSAGWRGGEGGSAARADKACMLVQSARLTTEHTLSCLTRLRSMVVALDTGHAGGPGGPPAQPCEAANAGAQAVVFRPR
jgi:hypothetical protein